MRFLSTLTIFPVIRLRPCPAETLCCRSRATRMIAAICLATWILIAAMLPVGCSKSQRSTKTGHTPTSAERKRPSGLSRQDARLLAMVPATVSWAMVGDIDRVQRAMKRFVRWIPYCPAGFETIRRNRALLDNIQAQAATWGHDHPGMRIVEAIYATHGTMSPLDPTNWVFVFELAGKDSAQKQPIRTKTQPTTKKRKRAPAGSPLPVHLCQQDGATRLLCGAHRNASTSVTKGPRLSRRFVPATNPFHERTLGIYVRLGSAMGQQGTGSNRGLWIWTDGDHRFVGMISRLHIGVHEAQRYDTMSILARAHISPWSRLFDEFVLFQDSASNMTNRLARLLPGVWKRLTTAGNDPGRLLPRILTGRVVLGTKAGQLALLIETISPSAASSLMSKLDLTMGGQKGIEYRPSSSAGPAAATISISSAWQQLWLRSARRAQPQPVSPKADQNMHLSIRSIGNVVAVTTSASIATAMENTLVQRTKHADEPVGNDHRWPIVIDVHLDEPFLSPVAPMSSAAVTDLVPKTAQPLVHALRCLAARADRLLIGVHPNHGDLAFAGHLSWLDLAKDDAAKKKDPYLGALRQARSHNRKAAMALLQKAASHPDSKTTRKASRTLTPWFAQGSAAIIAANLKTTIVEQWKTTAIAHIVELGKRMSKKLAGRRPGPKAPTPSVGLTPNTTCCRAEQGVCPHPASEWKVPAWKALAFLPGPDRFRYSLRWRRDGATWVLIVAACADLLCDGHRLVGIRTWRFGQNGFHDLSPLQWHRSHQNKSRGRK